MLYILGWIFLYVLVNYIIFNKVIVEANELYMENKGTADDMSLPYWYFFVVAFHFILWPYMLFLYIKTRPYYKKEVLKYLR